MAIAWRQSFVGSQNATPNTLASLTVTAADALCAFAAGNFNNITSVADTPNGTYTSVSPLALNTSVSNNYRVGAACFQNASANGGTAYGPTITTAGGTAWGWCYEYSGVTSIDSGVVTNAVAPGTPVSGSAIVVATGDLLIALCIDTGNHTVTPAAAGAGSTRDTSNLFSVRTALGEWTGAGASITPTFTVDGTSNFAIIQFVLHGAAAIVPVIGMDVSQLERIAHSVLPGAIR